MTPTQPEAERMLMTLAHIQDQVKAAADLFEWQGRFILLFSASISFIGFGIFDQNVGCVTIGLGCAFAANYCKEQCNRLREVTALAGARMHSSFPSDRAHSTQAG